MRWRSGRTCGRAAARVSSFGCGFASAMGFDWSVLVGVEYNQPLKWTDLTKLLNSFLTFRNDTKAMGPRALAARESGQVARRTRASVGEKRGAEEIEEVKDEEDEDENDDVPAPDPEKDIPKGERRDFFYREIAMRDNPYDNNLVYVRNGRWWYSYDAELNLEYNLPIMAEAFSLAMKELVGDEWAEKIVLRIDVGGAYGEADEGAAEHSLRLMYKVCLLSSFLLLLHCPTLHCTDTECSRRLLTAAAHRSPKGGSPSRGARRCECTVGRRDESHSASRCRRGGRRDQALPARAQDLQAARVRAGVRTVAASRDGSPWRLSATTVALAMRRS